MILTDIVLFFGRFHPLVVHLPIGFLMLAGLMEIAGRYPKYKMLEAAVPFTLLLGTISALVACIFGFMLANDGGYNQDALDLHQISGIILTAVAAIAYLLKVGIISVPQTAYYSSLVVTMALLMSTGHLGGNLTHGATYLTQHLPDPVKRIAGIEVKEKKERREISNLDSALVFEDVVQPMLDLRCISCHNTDKMKGELLLTTYDEVVKGGESGSTIVAGDPVKSELFHRITLSHSDDDFMPPDGKTPLTDDQVEIIKWWIETGADENKAMAEMETPEDMLKLVAIEVGLEPAQGTTVLPAVEVAEVDTETLDKINNTGFYVAPIAENIAFLDVRGSKEVDLDALTDVKDQILWLNLAGTDVSDEQLEAIASFPNLMRLRLERNPVSDAGIAHIANLQYLEYLNLYGTQVTDECIQHIAKLPKIKKLYLWQTKVSDEAIKALKESKPDLEIIKGLEVPTLKS